MTAKYPFFSFIIVCCVYKSGSNSLAKTKELFSEEVDFNFQRTISPVSPYNFLTVSVSLCSHSLKNFSGIYWCKNCSTVPSFLDEMQPIFPVTFFFFLWIWNSFISVHTVFLLVRLAVLWNGIWVVTFGLDAQQSVSQIIFWE